MGGCWGAQLEELEGGGEGGCVVVGGVGGVEWGVTLFVSSIRFYLRLVKERGHFVMLCSVIVCVYVRWVTRSSYNSVVFRSTTLNKYDVLLMDQTAVDDQTALEGMHNAFARHVERGESSEQIESGRGLFTGFFENVGGRIRNKELVRLEAESCYQQYKSPMNTFGDLLIVFNETLELAGRKTQRAGRTERTGNRNKTASLMYLPGDARSVNTTPIFSYEHGSLSVYDMVARNTFLETWCCSNWTLVGHTDSWTMPVKMEPWSLMTSEVAYCLARESPQKCSIEISATMLGVVMVCNLFKTMAMLVLCFRPSDRLLTIGDAIQSFLQNPDPFTRGHCLLENDASLALWSRSLRKSTKMQAPRFWRGDGRNWWRTLTIWRRLPWLIL